MGPPGRNSPAPPLRGRAPPGRRWQPARANNRGLARKRYAASYARGVALCPSLTRRASAPLARPEKEAELVMEEFNCGEKENSPDLQRVSRKFNPGFPPLVGRFLFLLFECRKTISFATLGEGRAGVKIKIPPSPAAEFPPFRRRKKIGRAALWGLGGKTALPFKSYKFR